MIRPEHPFDIRPDLRKAETTKAESTTAESVIRPKQLVRMAQWGVCKISPEAISWHVSICIWCEIVIIR